VIENGLSHAFEKKPTLKSKLLFMDYRFKTFHPGEIYITDLSLIGQSAIVISEPIIRIGREHFLGNNLSVPGGTSISRRHCLIINCKDDVWLCDLNSTGTYVNDERVNGKVPLVGKNIIRIGNTEYEVTNDRTKLL
jgi:hypothetical protein